MSKVAPKAHQAQMVGLPVQVVSPTDLGRLIRELEKLDDLLHQTALRGESSAKMPDTSRLLDKSLELNKVNLMVAEERAVLLQFLEAIRAKAPVLHMSFSADPPQEFMEKIASWFRKEIHPLALVTVGLQPNIGAGCVLRARNKYFDLSLRQDFEDKKNLLRDAIAEKMAPAVQPVVVAGTVSTQAVTPAAQVAVEEPQGVAA
jgi:hypothetical protein